MISALPKVRRSPLRYPGGKTRAQDTIMSCLPDGISEFREPFLGGGSTSIEFSRRYPDTPVWVNDIYVNLYKFWCVLQSHPQDLVDRLLEVKSSSNMNNTGRELFVTAKERINTLTDDFDIAVDFYILNKCSFSGLGESSSYSPQAYERNFTVSNISSLADYGKHISHWKITNLDYTELLSDDPNVFVYLDPPYFDVGRDGHSLLYGKKGEHHESFCHTRFHEQVNDYGVNILISYDASEPILRKYADWEQTIFDLQYSMRSDKTYLEAQNARKELLLSNYPLPKPASLEDFLT